MTDDDGGADPQAPTVAAKKAAVPSGELPAPERYRVLELLGGGGGGQVYKAYDEQLKRNVALKFLNAAGPEQITQLLTEARTQARVQHPGVCQVYEVVEGERPFIAMQLIDGPTLAAAKLTLPETVRVLRQVAEAVQAAHELGIVHRDLKPANIMLEAATDGWRPYVMDFGLAREVDKTLTNGVVGTPHFMAPEQARGDVDAIGRLTDIWALGATLYTVLSGKPPFDGESMMEILRRVDSEEPARLPSLPPELEAIVLRCLEKEPARRYPTAAALAADLAAFERGDPVSARPPGLTRRIFRRAARHRGQMSILVAAAVLSAALIVALRRPPPKWRPIIHELEPSYEEFAGKPHLSPDGKLLLFHSDRSGKQQLYVQPADGGPARLLARAGDASLPSWSSDGTTIYFEQSGSSGPIHIARMPFDESSDPVTLFEGGAPTECAGRLFYRRKSADGVQLHVYDADGTDRVMHTSTRWLGAPSCAPDGSRLVFNEVSPNDQTLWIDLKDGTTHQVPAPGQGRSENPMLRPDGHGVVVQFRAGSRSTLFEQPLDGRPARALTDGGHEFRPELSRDGRRLFFNIDDRTTSLTVHPLDGARVRQLASASDGSWIYMTLSPNGRELLGSRRIAKREEPEIVAVSVADGAERVLGPGAMPTVSPDGQNVFFRDNQHADTIGTMPLAGGPVRVVAQVPGDITLLKAAADALHVAVAHRAWRQPYDGSPGSYEGSPEVYLVQPAADGWSLALTVNGDRLIVVPPGPWPKVLPAPTRFSLPTLTADGRSFVALDSANMSWLVTFGGEERPLLGVPDAWSVSLAPDGKTLYTMEFHTHTRRAELTNYAELPRL